VPTHLAKVIIHDGNNAVVRLWCGYRQVPAVTSLTVFEASFADCEPCLHARSLASSAVRPPRLEDRPEPGYTATPSRK
jgi:hypothetical protein